MVLFSKSRSERAILEVSMSRRVLTAAAAFAIAAGVLSLVPTALAGQSANATSEAARAWTLPRTVDGHPDLQGYWTNDTFTPLERPPELAGKELFTEEEAAAYVKKRLDEFLAQPKDDIHYDDAIWQGETYVKEANLRTSLIVDPRDGKIPPLTPAAQKRAATRPAARTADSAESRSRFEGPLFEYACHEGNYGLPNILLGARVQEK
jgi:hypothetical protein